MKSSKLKTILSAIIFTVVLSSVVYSQTSLGLGIEGGINMADISTTPTVTTSGRTGMMVGVFADIGLSRSFSIKPGLRYTMKGFSSTGVFGNQFTDKLNYLEFPVLLKVSFPLAEVKPYIEAGPTLGIQLSATEQQAANGIQQGQDLDASSVYESTEFGLYFGSGFDFHVASKTDLFFGAGYTLGLSNISKSQNITAKNYGIRLTGGVKFNL